jgi:hypothetical protein
VGLLEALRVSVELQAVQPVLLEKLQPLLGMLLQERPALLVRVLGMRPELLEVRLVGQRALQPVLRLTLAERRLVRPVA